MPRPLTQSTPHSGYQGARRVSQIARQLMVTVPAPPGLIFFPAAGFRDSTTNVGVSPGFELLPRSGRLLHRSGPPLQNARHAVLGDARSEEHTSELQSLAYL